MTPTSPRPLVSPKSASAITPNTIYCAVPPMIEPARQTRKILGAAYPATLPPSKNRM
jgi:hypothetical protein